LVIFARLASWNKPARLAAKTSSKKGLGSARSRLASRSELEPAREPRANFPALASGALDTVRCAPELSVVVFSQRASAIIHQTVRCATRLSGDPTEQRSTYPTVDCTDKGIVNRAKVRSQKSEARTAKSERTGLSGVPPDCPVPQEDKGLQRSNAPNPNGWLTWHALDNEQYNVRCTTGLSGVPIDNKLSQWLGSCWRL
jgi:hypothetical protein